MEDYNINVFIGNVFYLIKRRGILVSEFENSLGISRGRLSRIMNGSPLSAELMIAISRELDMYVDDIFFYDKEPDRIADLQAEEQRLLESLEEVRAERDRLCQK